MSGRVSRVAGRHPVRTAAYRRFLGRLIEAREQRGLSQEAAAVALGIPHAELARMEAGKRRIDVIETAAFGRLYGKNLEYFAGVRADTLIVHDRPAKGGKGR